MAAASIAQVHRATLKQDDGDDKEVAVKIFRPGIEKRFHQRNGHLCLGRQKSEAWFPESRRLEPKKLIATLQKSVELEMDLRLEAAAASEMAELNADRTEFSHSQSRLAAHQSKSAHHRMGERHGRLGTPKTLYATAGHDLSISAHNVVQLFLLSRAGRRLFPCRHASREFVCR